MKLLTKHFLKNAGILALLLLCSLAVKGQSADAIKGTWWNAEKTSQIEVYEQNGKYYGKVVHLEEPRDENGNPRTDKENPDAKLRNRPLEGLVVLQGLEHQGGNVFEDGEIYDPKNGKTYSCNAKLVNKDQLDLRGYVGISLIGRTSTWTRVK